MVPDFVDVADLAEKLADMYLNSFGTYIETPYEGLEFSEEEIKESLRKEQDAY